jgi:cytochrome c oxidase assembly protein subunit 11
MFVISKFKHQTITIKLIVIVCAMFGFGYALIPIYRAICEMTGINVIALQEELNKNKTIKPENTQIDITRNIMVDFDSNVSGNTHAIWSFKPAQRSITAHPGQLITVQYELKNLQNRTVVGQAIPSYLPVRAAEYFNKVECFCFKQQILKPNESKVFPVVFSINPALGKDVTNITLSYTFFEVKGAL